MVLTDGTGYFYPHEHYQNLASGNISDSRTQVNNYFTDAASDDYTLKVNSLAIDKGIVPTKDADYNRYSSGFVPIWPYVLATASGMSVYQSRPTYVDRNHWFIVGGGAEATYAGDYPDAIGAGANRFRVPVSLETFDTGWDENGHGAYIAPQTPFIAFMDF